MTNFYSTSSLKAKNLAFILLFLKSFYIVGQQLHTTPTGTNTGSFNWSSTPNNVNSFSWANNSLQEVFNNVDGSGVNFTITFTGETGDLINWRNQSNGAPSPSIGTDPITSGYPTEALQYMTNGFENVGITITINFSKPIKAIGFDLLHINAGGGGGDGYTATATNALGNTVYPTFTESLSPSYSSNSGTGVINATSSQTNGQRPQIGVNFSDSDNISSITLVWNTCNTCTRSRMHGGGISSFNFVYINPCDPLDSGNADSDGDGVSDICDLDDDNDGILNVNEGGSLCIDSVDDNFNTPAYSLNTDLSGSLPLNNLANNTFNFNTTLIGAANWQSGVQIRNDVSAWGEYLYLQPLGTNNAGNYAEYDFDFINPVVNFTFRSSGLNNDDVYEIRAYRNGAPVALTTADLSSFVPIDSWNTTNLVDGVRIESSNGGGGEVDNYYFTTTITSEIDRLVIRSYKNNGGSTGSTGPVTTAISNFSYCTIGSGLDTDNDNTPDYLDSDSDDDGCPDAIEGAGNYTFDDLVNPGTDDSLGDIVDANGIPNTDGNINTDDSQSTTPAVTDISISIACTADISLTKTVNNALPKVGQDIIYTITVTNAGPLNATGVEVTDVLPTELTYKSDDAAASSTTFTANIWNIGDLTVGQTVNLQITCTVNQAGVIVNTAEVTQNNQTDVDSTPGSGN